MKEKSSLIRMVKDSEGMISIDKSGKLPGRGAYICSCKACLSAAQKGKSIERSLKLPQKKAKSAMPYADAGFGGNNEYSAVNIYTQLAMEVER